MAARSSASRTARNSFERLEQSSPPARRSPACGARTGSALRQTTFGARLFWDWQAGTTERYPEPGPAHRRPGSTTASASSAMSILILPSMAPLFPEADARRAILQRTMTGDTASRRFRRVRLRRGRLHQPGTLRLVRRARSSAGNARYRALGLDGRFRRVPRRSTCTLADGADAKLMHNAGRRSGPR